jgi:hypothetical protein
MSGFLINFAALRKKFRLPQFNFFCTADHSTYYLTLHMADLANHTTDMPDLLDNAPPVSTATTNSTSSSDATSKNAILNPFDPCLPLPDSERDSLYLITPQTWAEKNTGSSLQKERPRVKPTSAAKATNKITAEYNRTQAALLSADIEKLIQLQQVQIEKITRDHSHKVCNIEKLINHHTNYQHSRGPSLKCPYPQERVGIE